MLKFNLVTSPKDITKISQLAFKIWNSHYPSIIGQQQVDYMLANFQSIAAIQQQIVDQLTYFIVENDNTPIGYFAVRHFPKLNSLQISKLYIGAEQQRRGTGKATLLFIQDYGQLRDVHKLWLTVNRHNSDAILFYTKLEFEIENSLLIDIGNGFVMDDYKMSKII
ncbi:GNAT family N-acetyltransferase [Methyloprofundus sp.]|uniref:GNAT family N-acetyltransferase n=1 Tax=Methyloprofundus sp. TaxID=2020875 RepID=UPI003D13667E